MDIDIESQPLRREKALQTLGQEKLIGIVRTDSAESAIWTSGLLIDCGFRAIEIPFTVPEAVDVIEALTETYPDALIGAGTVMDLDTCYLALSAGAEFVVSPALVEALIPFGQTEDILVLPGCMTPTEIWRATELGALAVKFFPAQCAGGADFISAIKGPMPQVSIVPTGGIQLAHVSGYLKSGALAVGVGGPLIPKHLVTKRDEAALRELAMSYLSQAQPPMDRSV
ncbi:bifunctional 4-hydroxy-2-oxoglutarate aldolase/2-dehydro-3-deoxy-phosphogluconate aldolase [Vampirovibrio sp.]|uniref:bifunctional 4-hydroxy-2-oxoglutarate aldolase/2-dehydro-3-deoxy-phosphogluconate aldolase n=1 Tax=Vampirovibrio sp. TaxID=2717857 RepID=UPI00359493E3